MQCLINTSRKITNNLTKVVSYEGMKDIVNYTHMQSKYLVPRIRSIYAITSDRGAISNGIFTEFLTDYRLI